MQEDAGDAFDGDRAKVVWSMGSDWDAAGSLQIRQTREASRQSHSDLHLISDAAACDATLEEGATLDAVQGQGPLPPPPRPTQREVPKSFALPVKARGQAKKKHSLRTITGCTGPTKHADATTMAALLKGVTPTSKRASTPKQPEPPTSEMVRMNAASVAASKGLASQNSLSFGGGTTPGLGPLHGMVPCLAPPKSAQQPQLRSLTAPRSGMTMEKLLAKRPYGTLGDTPVTPASARLPGTPCPKSYTSAVTPQACATTSMSPLNGSNTQADEAAAAVTPSISTSTPMLVPSSQPGQPIRTPASLLQSGSSTGIKMGHRGSLRMLPGNSVAPAREHVAADAAPECPERASTDPHHQRTPAELLAGVAKQDKPSSLFDPMPSKVKKPKSKAGGVQQKLEEVVESLRQRLECALSMTAAELAGVPHIRCQTVCEPAFEGHLVKLLCDVEHVKLPSQAGSTEPAAESNQGGPQPEEDLDGMLTDATQAFVFFDSTAEKHVSLHFGSQFTILEPWDVVMTPFSDFPVVLAHVTVPQPQQ
eukprot:jgi/Ulvmu1/570/UM001_0578.1